MYMEEVKPKINRDKLKRRNKISHYALYRKHPHTTIKGRGIIARLRKKK